MAHCTLQCCASKDGRGWITPGEYVPRCPHRVPPFCSWGHTHITPQCCLVPHQQHPQPTPNRPSFPSGLTHRSGGCRHGQTGLQVPSTSLAGDPMRATPCSAQPWLGVPVPLSQEPHSRCWFSCSSQCREHPWPSQSQRFSSHSLLSPARCGQPGHGGCTARGEHHPQECEMMTPAPHVPFKCRNHYFPPPHLPAPLQWWGQSCHWADKHSEGAHIHFPRRWVRL